MLCILVFIIFLIFFPILGFFPEYRDFFKKSWSCVWKKATFKPCDINIGEEIKGKLLGKFIFKYPKLTKFIDKTFGFWALVFVIFNIWTLLYVANAGLNLLVYDTCNPTTGEGCALSGDSCEIGVASLSFSDALRDNKLGEWTIQPFTQFGDTVSRIPSRFKNWEPSEYLAETATYYQYNENNPAALEIIDPGCSSCKKLWENIKNTDFTDRYNLSYILYPIPSSSTDHGYRFNNSYFLSTYIEAIKKMPLESDTDIPTDWRFIDELFTARNEDDIDIQFMFSQQYGVEAVEAEEEVNEILTRLGYSSDQILTLNRVRQSQEIADSIDNQRKIVEDEVRTIKIPTILFDGRRYDRVVDTETLKK